MTLMGAAFGWLYMAQASALLRWTTAAAWAALHLAVALGVHWAERRRERAA
ncbi:MAG: hypothetical protein HKL90_11045 [Elusimicrobia bacterium]|nr:hypothetical protein [Elusimicrobiota bacterium]